MKQLRVEIVGYKFMGKAHSNAWRQASLFFDPEAKPVLKVACGRHQESLKDFAAGGSGLTGTRAADALQPYAIF